MGLLDGLLGGALQQMLGGGNQGNALMNIALKMLTGGGGQQQGGGGLGDLLQQFQNAGLGQQAQSWVSTGANMPISADQIISALGAGQIGNIAQQLGMQPQQAAGGLAQILPELINHLTPNGAVPQQNDLTGMLGGLMKQLGK